MSKTIPPDWDFETQELRRIATEAGLARWIKPEDVGMALDSPEAFIARMKAAHTAEDELAARRHKRRYWLAASSVAAAAVLVLGVVQPFGTARVEAATPQILDYEFAAADSISYAPGEDPSATFDELADVASVAPDVPVTGSTQHVVTDNWFAEVDTADDDGASAIIPQVSETWLGDDGALRLVERRDEALAPDGRGLPVNGSWDEQPTTADETQPAGSIDAGLAEDLPTEPAALRRALLRQAGCTDTAPGTTASRCLYEQVVELTRTYVMPTELSSAIWQVLGDEQGFRLLGSVKDRAGRDGVGLSLIPDDQPEYRLVLIADPDDGRVLGSEEILIHTIPGLKIKAPAIMAFSATLRSEYVD